MTISRRFLIMTRHLVVAGLVLFCAPIQAQHNRTFHSEPVIPAARDIDRLNMTMAWRAYLPVSSRTDGIAMVQLVDDYVFVQTRSNIVSVLRAATGEEEWRFDLPKKNLP